MSVVAAQAPQPPRAKATVPGDTFSNQRVRLLEIHNTRPSELARDLETVLKAILLDDKSSSVRLSPLDRINTLIVVAPGPEVFKTIEEWVKKLDVPAIYRRRLRPDSACPKFWTRFGVERARAGPAVSVPGHIAGLDVLD
jgi:hypothetical protein